MGALLEAHNITKDFPGVRALDNVSFTLEESQIHALCGENGAGKSTFINVLSGYFPSSSLQRGNPGPREAEDLLHHPRG